MPKFTFHCASCDISEQKYVPASKTVIECSQCGKNSNRKLPNLADLEVREVVDSFSNRKHKQNQREMLKERKQEYYWRVEVPRLVQKYSLETCLDQGWVYIDDDGEVHVHTKPPHKR